MSDTLYIQTDRNVLVNSADIYLRDIAQVTCSNASVLNRNLVRRIMRIPDERPGRYVVNVLDIIREIQKKEENVEITHLGEPSMILTYEKQGRHSHLWSRLKTLLVCLVTFSGAAFSIMTFQTDVDTPKLFAEIRELFTGAEASGVSALEICYCIGIGLGVLFYFNHFGQHFLTQDPSPMQVEMRLYEDDVNTTVIEMASRRE